MFVRARQAGLCFTRAGEGEEAKARGCDATSIEVIANGGGHLSAEGVGMTYLIILSVLFLAACIWTTRWLILKKEFEETPLIRLKKRWLAEPPEDARLRDIQANFESRLVEAKMHTPIWGPSPLLAFWDPGSNKSRRVQAVVWKLHQFDGWALESHSEVLVIDSED